MISKVYQKGSFNSLVERKLFDSEACDSHRSKWTIKDLLRSDVWLIWLGIEATAKLNSRERRKWEDYGERLHPHRGSALSKCSLRRPGFIRTWGDFFCLFARAGIPAALKKSWVLLWLEVLRTAARKTSSQGETKSVGEITGISQMTTQHSNLRLAVLVTILHVLASSFRTHFFRPREFILRDFNQPTNNYLRDPFNELFRRVHQFI